MTLPTFSGTGVALVTPFTATGDVDYDALRRLVDHVIEGGVDYLVALGTTAETPTLTPDEQQQIAATVAAQAAGRVPLVMGCGGNDTAATCRRAAAIDATVWSGALVVAPYYNKPTQRGLYAHFAAVAEASTVPLILYNIPSRTGTNVEPDTILRLVADYPGRFLAVKEASGRIAQINTLINRAPSSLAILSGDDALTLPLVALGGHGVISVIANILPREYSTLTRLCLKGDYAAARLIHHSTLPIVRDLFADGNPAGVKCALSLAGLCSNTLRLPLVPVSDTVAEQLRQHLAPFLK